VDPDEDVSVRGHGHVASSLPETKEQSSIFEAAAGAFEGPIPSREGI
jgi:hypothetical protein